jgi:hypothetical protein
MEQGRRRLAAACTRSGGLARSPSAAPGGFSSLTLALKPLGAASLWTGHGQHLSSDIAAQLDAAAELPYRVDPPARSHLRLSQGWECSTLAQTAESIDNQQSGLRRTYRSSEKEPRMGGRTDARSELLG